MANDTQAACWKLAYDAKISVQRLWELNPVLGSAGERCASQVWLGYYYCVATSGDGTSPSPTSTKPSTSPSSTAPITKPTQTQSGIDPNCNKFATGASCWEIANSAGIELSQLYGWNTVLGANGENCGTQIWAGYYYCVGTATPTTSQPATSTVVAPLPTQTQGGFPANCKRWMVTKSGDTCWSIGNDNGIALEVLYALNPVLGSDGENCGTQIWPEYAYCLAI